MKKILLSMGVMTSITIPVVLAVSCGSEDVTKSISNNGITITYDDQGIKSVNVSAEYQGKTINEVVEDVKELARINGISSSALAENPMSIINVVENPVLNELVNGASEDIPQSSLPSLSENALQLTIDDVSNIFNEMFMDTKTFFDANRNGNNREGEEDQMRVIENASDISMTLGDGITNVTYDTKNELNVENMNSILSNRGRFPFSYTTGLTTSLSFYFPVDLGPASDSLLRQINQAISSMNNYTQSGVSCVAKNEIYGYSDEHGTIDPLSTTERFVIKFTTLTNFDAVAHDGVTGRDEVLGIHEGVPARNPGVIFGDKIQAGQPCKHPEHGYVEGITAVDAKITGPFIDG